MVSINLYIDKKILERENKRMKGGETSKLSK